MKFKNSINNKSANLHIRNVKCKKIFKLDKKSSRGMIYENEELRLRTININAEVERGQSDIKRLKKENELLRREIWTLRDECDRLSKKVKAKFIAHESNTSHMTHCCHANANNDRQCRCFGAGLSHSKTNSDGVALKSRYDRECYKDNDSLASTCYCTDENTTTNKPTSPVPDVKPFNEQSINGITNNTNSKPINNSNLLIAFDHLSVVSEESPNNTEIKNQSEKPIMTVNSNVSGSIVHGNNEFKDLQTVVPPLSYFENILAKHMVPKEDYLSRGNKMKTITKHTNSWDYNLQSPFAQNLYSLPTKQINRTVPHNLTTFVSTNLNSNISSPTYEKKNKSNAISIAAEDSNIQTVPINTKSMNNLAINNRNNDNNQSINNINNNNSNTVHNERKQFFSPLKPKLKINTSLVNHKRIPPVVPLPPTPPPLPKNDKQRLNSKLITPDLYGVASDYKTLTSLPKSSLNNTSKSNPNVTNLDDILNDMKTLSENLMSDIHYTKLEKSACSKTYKPYKSEMNLLLSYDELHNPIIKQLEKTNLTRSNTDPKLDDSNHSLNGEKNNSPSPYIPDPMVPFPNNRYYLNLDCFKNKKGSSPITNVRKLPPDPPVRTYSTSLKNPVLYDSSAISESKTQLYEMLSKATANVDVLKDSGKILTPNGKLKTDIENQIENSKQNSKEAAPENYQNELNESPKKCVNNQTDNNCFDLPTIFSNTVVNQKFKQDSQISQNSPETNGKSHDDIRNVNNTVGTIAESLNSTLCNGYKANSSNSFILNTKCSRRHSNAVLQTNKSDNGINRNTNINKQHHHHKHQNVCNDNENLTYSSERNSTTSSLSTNSSTKFSTRSQRRLSINSHAVGKIPWCGCWGNGCM